MSLTGLSLEMYICRFVVDISYHRTLGSFDPIFSYLVSLKKSWPGAGFCIIFLLILVIVVFASLEKVLKFL
jgi:hypothetical protein